MNPKKNLKKLKNILRKLNNYNNTHPFLFLIVLFIIRKQIKLTYFYLIYNSTK